MGAEKDPPGADELAPPTALVKAGREALTPAGGDGTPRRPIDVFKERCTSAQGRRTMLSRLNVAADVLAKGSTADTYAWEGLSRASVDRVLAELRARKAAPATINVTRAALLKMAKVLYTLRWITVEERQDIEDTDRATGRRDPRGYALDAKELRKMFRAAERDPTAAGRRDAAIVAVLFGAGLRRDEAAQLEVSDYRAGKLYVRGKGDKQGETPIGAEVSAALDAWLAVRGRGAGPLFVAVNKAGAVGRGRLSGAAVAYAVDRLAKRAQLPRQTTPHDLRRTFVTHLLEAGEDLSTVAKAARHSAVTTTAIYDRRSEKKVVEAVAKLHVPFGR